MDAAAQLDAVRRESTVFYDTAEAARDRAAPVPSCPEWSVDDLIWHLAEVHWFWATIAEQRIAEASGLETLPHPERPPSDELIAFGRAQLDHLLEAITGVDPSTPVWTWAHRQDIGFIQRHQVQEAAVHRWDMELATGVDRTPIAPAVAADSIDEFLSISLAYALGDAALPGSVHLHCTDTSGEWIIHADGAVEPVHAKGDAAIRGSASNLLLALYRRVPLTDLEVIGNESVATDFISRLTAD
ncbi:MAG: hypothetical protein QOK06_274 [Acidimicrobiaceae bacterium]